MIKKIFALCLLSAITFTSHAQQTAVADCNCPKPKGGKFLNICTLVENQDFAYKKEIKLMSCVDLLKDSSETIRRKVNCMWEKYYTEFSCEGDGFSPPGNVLKYAVNQGFDYFIDGMVKEFGVNINIKDPANGKTLLDFVLSEINRYKSYYDYKEKAPDAIRRVDNLERTYNHFKNDLYALHASELSTQPDWRQGVKISLATDVLKKYVGKFSLQLNSVQFLISIKLDNGKLLFSENNKKVNELFAETDTKFFLDPNTNSRYEFILNNSTGKYGLTIKIADTKYQTTRLD